jgi:hypothetical protein
MSTDRLDKALSRLIEEGSMSSEQGALLRQAYLEGDDRSESRISVFAEIAIYLGGAFVVFASTLIVGSKWQQSPMVLRTGLLALLAIGLAALAIFLGDKNAMRLRLTSVLSMGSAVAATGAVAIALNVDGAPWLPFSVGTAIALFFFIRHQHEILHIGTYGYLFITGLLILGAITGTEPEDSIVYAFYWVILASIWIYLSMTRMIEPLLGYLVSAATLFLAVQFLFISDNRIASYLVSIAAAITLGWIFLQERRWPLMLGVVLITTFTVGEFVGSTLGGSIGALIGLFAAGVALISTSLYAMRKLH